ncbi:MULTISPECIES: SRPBCC family protein [unclassified Streptomyces]|uniref:SRPBCC family protein n=1 Tax=unclassified Streptomyces TaxID=2593676 RepID=UPI001660D047|nr:MULTISPECIES: SRPBCC family protein [unclassified Streptomyces]MBD0710375.1 MxaD family protein [Streptomyces sp. CBMA291]MBD0712710.1 MxaD family protein [Streptomyces sp. CBMA370]
MARRLRPVGLDFTASAPVRLVFGAVLVAPPPAVYRSLAVEVGSLPAWFTAVASAVPTADGTGRTLRLRGGVVFEETILAAEPDVRYAYRVDSTNAPGMTALAEEWALTPEGRGTRLRWTMAADGPAPFRLALRCAAPGMALSFRDAARRLDRRLTPAIPPSPGTSR